MQLEVTQKLLEAETKKLKTLESEFSKTSNEQSASLLALRQMAQKRLQMQFEQLNKEYQDAAAGLFRGKTVTRVRSLPSIGLKSLQKRRTSIFDSIASGVTSEPSDEVPSPLERPTSPGLVDSKDLVVREGRIVSATLDALVERFLPSAEFAPDKLFTFAFLITHRLFMPPASLMAKLSERGKVVITPDAAANIVARFAKQLSEWTSAFPYDFRDERMMLPFKELTQACASHDSHTKTMIGDMQRHLFKKLSDLEQVETRLRREYELQIKSRTETVTAGKVKSELSLRDVCSDARVLAVQLKAIEQERFCAIGPEEFIQTFIRVDEDMSDSMRVAHNVEAYVEWFNRLSYLVATEIMRCERSKDRVAVIEFFLDVAKHSKALHNYNSLMAIISALNMFSVTRLKKTWSKLSSKLMTDLEQLEWALDPTSNFKNYRDELSERMDREAVIPFFSLFVKDIYFINESTEKMLPNGHVNFEKMWMLSDQLASFMFIKHNLKDIAPEDVVQRFLKTTPLFSEFELFRLSVECEAPEKRDQPRTMERLRKMSVSEDDGRSSPFRNPAASPEP